MNGTEWLPVQVAEARRGSYLQTVDGQADHPHMASTLVRAFFPTVVHPLLIVYYCSNVEICVNFSHISVKKTTKAALPDCPSQECVTADAATPSPENISTLESSLKVDPETLEVGSDRRPRKYFVVRI